jgi:hypothetical protein
MPRHVDDFIDDPSTDRYAAHWFEAFRRPAIDKLREPNDAKLFATYRGKRWRVMGCSRLGDVWLNETTHLPENGYVLRVDVDACSEWGPVP